MTIIIIVLLLGIIISLFSGLYFLLKDESKSKRTVNALTWRVGLQVLLIVVLVIAFFMGKIRPHGVFPEQQGATTETQTKTGD
ncbi:MAG: twin transmembrane helix small protein [Salinisphaeraceae bacterium]|nr:twin transmembrane helix small protein [Salinisphaeraceae bacterium]